VTQSKNLGLATMDPLNMEGYEYASITDQTRMWQEHQINLFFSPIKAFLFGVGYSFMQTDYFRSPAARAPSAPPPSTAATA
jgi:hypothetical protein